MTDLDDLINNEAEYEGDFPVETEPDGDFGFTGEGGGSFRTPAPNFITAMCVHNQHLYIATISGGLYRNFLRQKGNKWEPVDLPPDFDG